MSFFFSAESPVKNIPGNVPASCIGQQNEYICHTCCIVNDTIPLLCNILQLNFFPPYCVNWKSHIGFTPSKCSTK